MANRNREAVIRDELVKQLKVTGQSVVAEYTLVVNRVKRQVRKVDIYSATNEHKHIYEVKQASRYHHAIGQLMASLALIKYKAQLAGVEEVPTMVVVLYGNRAELDKYTPECKLVLDSLAANYGIIIKLLTREG